MTLGRAYGIPTAALRYFNVYGPRQALSNPNTGVASIFCSRLLNGNRPLIFEDGRQSHDFVHVSDVVCASLLALERDKADFEIFFNKGAAFDDQRLSFGSLNYHD
jgi:dTDP-L-rhamnose 4-epimerase